MRLTKDERSVVVGRFWWGVPYIVVNYPPGMSDDEYKEVLVLRDVQGFSYEEIRDILKVPDGTVKSRLFRARDALKECLKKALGDP